MQPRNPGLILRGEKCEWGVHHAALHLCLFWLCPPWGKDIVMTTTITIITITTIITIIIFFGIAHYKPWQLLSLFIGSGYRHLKAAELWGHSTAVRSLSPTPAQAAFLLLEGLSVIYRNGDCPKIFTFQFPWMLTDGFFWQLRSWGQ